MSSSSDSVVDVPVLSNPCTQNVLLGHEEAFTINHSKVENKRCIFAFLSLKIVFKWI